MNPRQGTAVEPRNHGRQASPAAHRIIPVTGEFRNVNGKVEMLVHIQNQVIVYINDGTQFKPQ